MKSLLRMCGLGVFLWGIATIAYFHFFFDVSVAVPDGHLVGIDRVANLSLMDRRSEGRLEGVGLLILGGGLIYLGRSGAGTTSTPREKTCPHCAETILADAKLCKHCKSAVA